MANITTGSIVADIRGKVGSEIYSRNRGGAYVKAFTSPSLNYNANQLNSQSILAGAVSAWQSLTDDEYLAWKSFASTITKAGTFGKRHPSPKDLFIGRTINLAQITGAGSFPIPENPPASPDFLDFSVTASVSGLSIAASPSLSVKDTDYGINYKVNRAVAASVRSINSVTFNRVLGSGQVGPSGDNLYSGYDFQYGTTEFVDGNRLFVKRIIVHLDTGVVVRSEYVTVIIQS